MEVRLLGAGRVGGGWHTYELQLPGVGVFVFSPLADPVCRRRCPYTGECIDWWCPARVRLVVESNGGTVFDRELDACRRIGYVLPPGRHTVRLRIAYCYPATENCEARLREVASIITGFTSPGELGDMLLIGDIAAFRDALARAAAADAYARLGGLTGLLRLTRLYGLVIPPQTGELVVFDGPVYFPGTLTVYAGPAPAVDVTVECPSSVYEGMTVTNPAWCKVSRAATRLGGVAEVCIDGRCARGETVVGYWRGGWRMVSMSAGPGVHHVTVKLSPAPSTRRPDHGVVEGGVTVWDGHMVKGYAAATLIPEGEPRIVELKPSLTVCLGETAEAEAGRAYTEVELTAAGRTVRLRPGTVKLNIAELVDTTSVRGRARVKLSWTAVAPNTRLPRPRAPQPRLLSEVKASGSEYIYVPDTEPAFEPMRASGGIELEILSPWMQASSTAPEHLDPNATGTVTLTAVNTGSCTGAYTLTVRVKGRTYTMRVRLQPGQQAVLEVRFTMPVGDLDVEAEAVMERADGLRREYRRRHTVRMMRTVWLHDGLVELRGGPEEATVALLLLAAYVKPRVETETRIVAPGILASLIVARLQPYERVIVAEYKMLMGARMKATHPFSLAIGRELIASHRTEAEYYANPLAAAAAKTIPLPQLRPARATL